MCQQCYSATYYAAHGEERRAKSKAYYIAHKEERRARDKTYYATHREERAAYGATHYAAHKEEKRAYRAAHKEEARVYRIARRQENRAGRLARNYGITAPEYDAILAAQGGVCKICGRVSSGPKDFTVDHDHRTGKVRGVLCNSCNAGIGFLREDLTILASAGLYLRDLV